jgi:hypothetical protein
MTGLPSRLKKLSAPFGRQVHGYKCLTSHPPTQVRHQPQVLLHRPLGISLLGEFSGQAVYMHRQRTRCADPQRRFNHDRDLLVSGAHRARQQELSIDVQDYADPSSRLTLTSNSPKAQRSIRSA